jgi:hypothetical protein
MTVLALTEGKILMQRSARSCFYLRPAFPVGDRFQTVFTAIGVVTVAAELLCMTGETLIDLAPGGLQGMDDAEPGGMGSRHPFGPDGAFRKIG